jgi:hypothetical protein
LFAFDDLPSIAGDRDEVLECEGPNQPGDTLAIGLREDLL